MAEAEEDLRERGTDHVLELGLLFGQSRYTTLIPNDEAILTKVLSSKLLCHMSNDRAAQFVPNCPASVVPHLQRLAKECD